MKQYCKEQALFCSIGVCVLVLLSICAYLSPIAEQIQALFLKTELDVQYLELLWKSIGICYLTSIAADLCRDTGETAMASVAELWGRDAGDERSGQTHLLLSPRRDFLRGAGSWCRSFW